MKNFRYISGIALASSLLLTQPLYAQSTLASFQTIPFALPADTRNMLVLDLDRDGLQDLVAVQEQQLAVYFQRSTDQDGSEGARFNFSSADTILTLPGVTSGWQFPALAGLQAESDPAVIALIDGQQVVQWQISNRQFSSPDILLAADSGLLTGNFLAPGAWQLDFYQDINNDGRADLVVPGPGVMNLLIRNADGSFQPPLSVQADVQQRARLNAANELDREIGQSLQIPMMQLRDVNNDGLPDLISDTETRLDVFLASANSDYFPQQPSYSINREAIRERLGEFDVDQLDLANLTGVLALTHEELLQDVNGDDIADFVLREGGRVALHLGKREGSNTLMNLEQPDQILRSSGNVLSVFLADENEDGRPDLWLWRVDQVSIGDLFLWLAVSGTINIEAFIYPNEGEQFARRPSRRITVALRFPSVVRMIGSVEDIRERARSLDTVIPWTRAQVTTDAQAGLNDLLVLMQDQVEVFYQQLQPEAEQDEDRFLASLGYARNRDSYEIDLRRIIEAFNIDVNREVNAARVREADLRVPLPEAAARGEIVATDLNNNGIDDIFVFLNRDRDSVRGLLFLSTDN
jgi:hypothetical protein